MSTRAVHSMLRVMYVVLALTGAAYGQDDPEGGGCGSTSQFCCSGGVCDAWNQCVLGFCAACGGLGQPACGTTTCQPGLCAILGVCQSCACGAPGEFCCEGFTCDAWNQCVVSVCAPCGDVNQPICTSGSACMPGLVVSAGFCDYEPVSSCDEPGEFCCTQTNGSCTCSGPWLQQYLGVCGGCGGTGELICVEGDGPLCQPWHDYYGEGICTPCGGDGEPACMILANPPCQPGFQEFGGFCYACDPCAPSCSGYSPCACDSCHPDCGPFYVDAAASPPGNGSSTSPYPTLTAAVDAVGDCFKEILIAGGSYNELLTIDKNVKLAHNGGPAVRIGE